MLRWLNNRLAPLPKLPTNHTIYTQDFFLFNVMSYLTLNESMRLAISNKVWYSMLVGDKLDPAYQNTHLSWCDLWLRYATVDLQLPLGLCVAELQDSTLQLYTSFADVIDERNRVMELQILQHHTIPLSDTFKFRVYDTSVKQLVIWIKQATKHLAPDPIRGELINHNMLLHYIRGVSRDDMVVEPLNKHTYMDKICRTRDNVVHYPFGPIEPSSRVGFTPIGRYRLDVLTLFKVCVGCNVL